MRVNTLYGTKEVMTEQGRQMELRYYLVQDIRPEKITYGIRIIKTEAGEEEQECLPGLTHQVGEAEHLLRDMMYGLVTPVTAAAIADDWIVSRE